MSFWHYITLVYCKFCRSLRLLKKKKIENVFTDNNFIQRTTKAQKVYAIFKLYLLNLTKFM